MQPPGRVRNSSRPAQDAPLCPRTLQTRTRGAALEPGLSLTSFSSLSSCASRGFTKLNLQEASHKSPPSPRPFRTCKPFACCHRALQTLPSPQAGNRPRRDAADALTFGWDHTGQFCRGMSRVPVPVRTTTVREQRDTGDAPSWHRWSNEGRKNKNKAQPGEEDEAA